jgi:hypothetical protein
MPQNFTSIDDLIDQQVISAGNWGSSSQDDAMMPKKTSKIPSESFSHSKEAEPGRTQIQESSPIHEAIEKQEVEPDVAPFIEVKPQNITVEPDLKKHGLQPIEKTKYKDFQNVVLPLSDEKIEKGLHEPVTSSLRWLATFATYLLHQSHLKLKVIHGKVVRVFQK